MKLVSIYDKYILKMGSRVRKKFPLSLGPNNVTFSIEEEKEDFIIISNFSVSIQIFVIFQCDYEN